MTAKAFVLKSIAISFLIIVTIAGTNYFIDLYGLFRNSKGIKIPVYTNERTSKYLLSFKYIPENYEGFIFGPSLSDNLDPRGIPEYKIYNASIKGANISELRFLVNNIVANGKPKLAIICLDPYLTKDHGKKSAMIDPKEYYGALGSYNLLVTYVFKFLKDTKLLSAKLPVNAIDEMGYNNFNLSMQGWNAKQMILDKVQKKESETTAIDTIALRELGETLDFLRVNKVKIYGYFNPVPYQIREINSKGYQEFTAKVSALFTSKDVLIDLNTPDYYSFTQDFANYSDQGHLSHQGQAFVVARLREALLLHEVK